MLARMLATEASAPSFGRQVFWLTARNGFRTTFPQLGIEPSAVVYLRSEASPITAAAPQRICTVFPFPLHDHKGSAENLSKLRSYV